MTYLVQVTISCDADGCEERRVYTAKNEGGLTKTSAGARAAWAGWYVRGEKWPSRADPRVAYCPEHREGSKV